MQVWLGDLTGTSQKIPAFSDAQTVFSQMDNYLLDPTAYLYEFVNSSECSYIDEGFAADYRLMHQVRLP